MQEETQALIDKANLIVKKTGHGPGVRYPKKLKDIVRSLANDHNLSTKQIINAIPISHYSARQWPQQSKNKFKKIAVKKDNTPTPKKTTVTRKYILEFQITFLSLQVLLLALQIFLQ